ncbi:coatomer subunit zeta-1 [Pelomyxa schiedti]|nr:coatomer subunit zeta-1 [Pelomyxa schiedti]
MSRSPTPITTMSSSRTTSTAAAPTPTVSTPTVSASTASSPAPTAASSTTFLPAAPVAKLTSGSREEWCPLYCIKGLVVLDGADGSRLCCKYYSNPTLPTPKEQKAFEKRLFSKTSRASSEILLFDNFVVLYKIIGDVNIYLLGSIEENELLLSSVLNTFIETLMLLFKNQVDKRMITDYLDMVLLAMEELIDNGVILECDPAIIASRVTLRTPEGDLAFAQQGLSQALIMAREQIVRALSS